MQSLSIAAHRPLYQKFMLFAALLLAALMVTTPATFADWSDSDGSPASAELGTLEMRIYDSGTSSPVAGAQIVILDATGSYKVATAQSNRAGQSALQLSHGVYQVRVDARGYRTYHRVNVSISAGSETGLNISLDSLSGDGLGQ